MTTGIDYGGEAWNVVAGCSKKSQGCADCWAMRMAKRLQAMGRPEYQGVIDKDGNWSGQAIFMPHRLNEPLKWKKPRTVLVAFMGDMFHESLNVVYIERVFDVMKRTPQHTYMILTKRASNMEYVLLNWEPLPNVMLGVSVENQRAADERREFLHILADKGWRTWVSFEPALEAVDWRGWEFIKWMACGGESGAKARVMPARAPRMAHGFCSMNNIPFYFKQWGEWAPLSHLAWITDKTTFKYRPLQVDGEVMVRVGKGMAGHVLDGQEWREAPK
jgi:protein gp37